MKTLYLKQVLAFQKSWGGGGGGWGHVPHPHEEAAVSVLKKFSHIYMYGNVLVVFGVVWGISRP